jgi:2-keto-4-pentenoate hydratase
MIDEAEFDPAPAARTLAKVWRGAPQLGELPLSARPTTLAEGYALQRRLREELGERVVGYKLGLSSAAAMERSGLNEPIAGFVPESRLFESGANIEVSNAGELLIEIEIAFRLSRSIDIGAHSLDAKYGLSARLAFEIVRSRFAAGTAVGLPSFVGDGSGMHALVIGDVISLEDLPAVTQEGATLRRDGEVVANPLPVGERPEPFDVLRRFERLAATHGMPVATGMFISTGSLIAPVLVEHSGVFEAVLGPYRATVMISKALPAA